MEKSPRNPRSIAEEKNTKKPGGEHALGEANEPVVLDQWGVKQAGNPLKGAAEEPAPFKITKQG